MRITRICRVVAVVLFVVALGSVHAFSSETQTSADRDTLLYVRTEPAGAKVFLDGKELGTSNDTFEVGPGVGRVGVVLDGHQPQTKEVTIEANRVTRIELTLRPKAVEPPWKTIDASMVPCVAQLPSGVSVELYGVGENPSKDRPWWRPDGSPLAERPYESLPGKVESRPGYVSREFAVLFRDLPEEPASMGLDFDPHYVAASGGHPKCLIEDVDELRAMAVSLPADQSTVTVRVRVADGPWTTVQEGTAQQASSTRDGLAVAFSAANDANGITTISVMHNVNDLDVRVVAVGNDGREHRPSSAGGLGAGGSSQITATFSNLSPKDIRAFRLQTRPYRSIEFRNVSLHAKEQDDAQTTMSKDVSVSDNDNLIKNPGAETGDKVPDAWQEGAAIPGVRYLWDKNVAHGGKASLSIKKTANRYFPIAQWFQEIEHTGDAKAVELSAQVKAKQMTKAILDVLFLDKDGQWIKHQWAAYIGAREPGDPPADHDWRQYAGTVDIPPGTAKIVIGLQVYGPGQVWFDDVRTSYQPDETEE